ncbi:hypothetical protein B0H14DRAFT_3455500 [Mycena olivaceomarginata]|nr:hypothetical protein B0H14DRAFT_3455500 [Mycena olivaceomarginata]
MSEYILYTAPILAGTQANWALLATLTVQVFFPLELAQTGVSSHYAYWVLALGWGNTTVLEILPWSCLATPIFTGITAALVQIFFAWSGYYLPVEAENPDPLKAYFRRRIYLLMRKTAWACVVTAVVVLGVTILFVVAQFAHATAFANVMRIMAGVKSWLIVAAVCDVFITTTLIIIFLQYRMQMPPEERRTDTFMVKLMLNTVETGAVTSVTALIYLVVFLLYPESNIEETPTFILGKLQVSPQPPGHIADVMHAFSDTPTSFSSL